MMANKIKLKKYLLCTLLIAIVLIGIFLSINIYEYYTYRKDVNNKMTEIINEVAEKYPEATIIVKSQGGSGWMYNGETSQRTCLVQYNENEDKNFDVIFITTGANDGLQNFSIGNYEKMLDVLFREDITINGYMDKPIYPVG